MADFSHPSDWLIGTWQSDKEATLAAWSNRSSKFLSFMESRLGKFQRRFTAKRAFAIMQESTSSQGYRILWQNQESIFLVHGPKGQEHGEIIHFLSPNRFRVEIGEHFKRVGT